MVFRMLAALAIEVIAGCRTAWRHSLGSTLARPTSSHGLIVPDSVLSLQNFALVQAGAARKSFAGKVRLLSLTLRTKSTLICLDKERMSQEPFDNLPCVEQDEFPFVGGQWHIRRMIEEPLAELYISKDTGANASIDGSYSHDDALHRSQKLDLSVRVLRAD